MSLGARHLQGLIVVIALAGIGHAAAAPALAPDLDRAFWCEAGITEMVSRGSYLKDAVSAEKARQGLHLYGLVLASAATVQNWNSLTLTSYRLQYRRSAVAEIDHRSTVANPVAAHSVGDCLLDLPGGQPMPMKLPTTAARVIVKKPLVIQPRVTQPLVTPPPAEPDPQTTGGLKTF